MPHAEDRSQHGSRAAYPWLIVLLAMLTFLLVNGLTAGGLAVYDPSLLDAFGWSRGDLKYRDVLTFWIAGALAPVVGLLVDRLNPRYLLAFGLACLAAGLYGYSVLVDGRGSAVIDVLALVALAALAALCTLGIRLLAPRLAVRWAAVAPVLFAGGLAALYALHGRQVALYQLYVIHLVLALAIVTSGGVVIIVLVSSWFERRRGLALGVALLGTSIGSAVFPAVNVAWTAALGWRDAFRADALLPAALAIAVLVLVRGMPRHAGTVAVGQAQGARDLNESGVTFREALRTRAFWAIAASGALAYYAIIAFVQHLTLHMNGSLGIPMPQVAWAFMLYSVLAMAAKLAGGALADRIDRHKVFLACLAILLAGMIGLATLERSLLLPSIVAIGLGWGGLFTLYSMLAVSCFGLREFGRINGAIVFFENIGVGAGSWVTGRVYDAHGDYRIAFAVVAVAVALALVSGTQVRRELARPTGAGTEPTVEEKEPKLMA